MALITISVSALGELKKSFPNDDSFILEREGLSIAEVFSPFCGPAAPLTRISFIVNGRVQKENYILNTGDKVVVLKLGGAG